MANDLTAKLTTIKQMMKEHKFSSAADEAKAILKDEPQHREALYLLAVNQRYQSDLTDALSTIDRLLTYHSDFGRAHQERAHCYKALNKPDQALAAYMQAVQLNPTLIASWRMVNSYQKQAGEEQIAAIAIEKIELLGKRHPLLNSIESMCYEGYLSKAETLCRQYLQKQPRDTEAMRLLAFIGAKLNVLDDAEFLLESALEFSPDFSQARYDYVNVLHRRQKYAQAVGQSGILLNQQPANLSFKILHANESVAVGDFDTAIPIYQDTLQAMPDNPNLHLVYGHALKTLGRQPEAISAYQQAYQHKPDFGDAYWSLANLKTYQFTEAEIAQMREQAENPTISIVDKYHLYFAMGKAFEDSQDYETSIQYYIQGNQLKRTELNYQPERLERDFSLQKQYVTESLIEKYQGAGEQAVDPIFILGLPRAGSTLLEQIIASHSQVDGTLELPNILAFVHKLNGRMNWDDEPKYPANLVDIEPVKLQQMGQQYLEDTRIHRQGAPFFIDKMPNNFRHIGLIKLILPNAKIIDARRDSMDCCFSGFKQLFAEGQEFTYSLEDIGRYYNEYVELMNHWDALFPGEILRVQYEDVVANLEHQLDRIFDYLELPLEESCLNFFKTKRQVRTASSEQVRQPINKAGLARWKPYAEYLEPLNTTLRY